MNNVTDKTLGDLVKDDFRKAMVFEKYQLDFCCKGKRSLQVACKEKGIDEKAVLNDLASIGPKPKVSFGFDPENVSLTALADYIVTTHHYYVRNELPRISGMLQKVAGKHGTRFPEMTEVARLFEELQTEFVSHMQKEETILFPRIKKLEQLSLSGQLVEMNIPLLKSPILMMEHEHDQSGIVMAVIRKLTDNYTTPDGACTTHRVVIAALETFEMDLHRHVHLENNILFPNALKLLA